MKWITRKALAFGLAVLVVTAAFGVATQTGMIERDDAPVQEADAAVCGGICLVGAGVAAGIAAGAVAYHVYDEDVNTTKITNQDKQETKEDVYVRDSTQGQNNRIITDSLSNYLQDTESIALMKAKNEYIRQLEAGESEAEARAAAKDAASDYLSRKQQTLIDAWNTSAIVANSSESSLHAAGITADRDGNFQNGTRKIGSTYSASSVSTGVHRQVNATSVTLANGTTVGVLQIEAYIAKDSNSGSPAEHSVHILTGYTTETDGGGDLIANQTGVAIQPPTSSYDTKHWWNWTKYKRMYNGVNRLEKDVLNQVDNFVDTTYDSYERGEIDPKDLVDPYLAARKYSPEGNFGTWSLRTAGSLGITPPENVTELGTFVVEDHVAGENRTGILLSDGLPSNKTFEVGVKYDAANLKGSQFMLNQSNGQMRKLAGNFTLHRVTNETGHNLTKVAYSDVNYTTTDMDDFQNLMKNLTELQQKIEAQESEWGSGGGALLGGSSSKTLLLVLGAAALFVAYGGRNNGGRYNGRR